MAAFDTINRGSAANDGTGDPARDWAEKTNNNFAKAANVQEENIFLKKQTIKAATNDGSTALEIKDSDDITNLIIKDDGEISDLNTDGFLCLGAPETIDISSDSITITKSYVELSGEGGVADTLSIINGGNEGCMLVIKRGTGDITVDEAGNIRVPGSSVLLNSGNDRLMLIKAASIWSVISFSDN